MGFLKGLFNKKEVQDTQNKVVNQEAVSSEKQEQLQEKIEAFYQKIKAASQTPVVYFTLEKGKPDLFDCKVGGAYYVPENETIPMDQIENSQLYLLAQINFAQCNAPEGFPTSGLLQIFISGDDDVYGCDFDNPTSQKRWTIRYLKEIPKQPLENRIFQPNAQKETMLPFPVECEYKMIPHNEMQAMTVSDYRFEDCFAKACQDLLEEGQHSISDLENDVYDGLCDKLETFASQIGGYPCFTQYDPREYMQGIKPDVLLFQLDTVEDIMWGDSGVVNFFISQQDLENKDFSKVVYNWDCM